MIPVLIAGMLLAYTSDLRIIAAENDRTRSAVTSQKQYGEGLEENILYGTREYTDSVDVTEAIRINIDEKTLREKRLLETMRKPPNLIPFSLFNGSVKRSVHPVKEQDTDQTLSPSAKHTWHGPDKPRYIPGEVLIQLHQEARDAVNLHIDAGIARFNIPNLDVLDEQYRVAAIRPVLEAVPDGGEALGLDLIFVMEVSDDIDIEALSEVATVFQKSKRFPELYSL